MWIIFTFCVVAWGVGVSVATTLWGNPIPGILGLSATVLWDIRDTFKVFKVKKDLDNKRARAKMHHGDDKAEKLQEAREELHGKRETQTKKFKLTVVFTGVRICIFTATAIATCVFAASSHPLDDTLMSQIENGNLQEARTTLAALEKAREGKKQKQKDEEELWATEEDVISSVQSDDVKGAQEALKQLKTKSTEHEKFWSVPHNRTTAGRSAIAAGVLALVYGLASLALRCINWWKYR